MKPKGIIFASGTEIDGGTGAENLAVELPDLFVAMISNHERGGVMKRSKAVGMPFFYFPGPYTQEGYREVVKKVCKKTNVSEGDLWYVLSGWFKKVYGLDPARTINIHPASLPRFGGKGMYGEKLHRVVWDTYKKGEITESEVVMHFVTPEYDQGPIFFRSRILMKGARNFEEFRNIVRSREHSMQPRITRLVMEKKISWNGKDPASLKVPEDYWLP